jgi:hypothetical protein
MVQIDIKAILYSAEFKVVCGGDGSWGHIRETIVNVFFNKDKIMNKSPQDPDEFKFAEKFPVQMQK